MRGFFVLAITVVGQRQFVRHQRGNIDAGDLPTGHGTVGVASGVFEVLETSWRARTEDADGKTSPEELLAAAHASCFSMASSNNLAKAGFVVTRSEVTAKIRADRTDAGWTVLESELTLRTWCPGVDEDTYRKAVDAAATAKAKVEQAEQEKREAEVVALKRKIAAEGEANAVRETARGRADGELFIKTAEAKGKELVGLAEAKALEAQGLALRSNPGLVQLEFAKRWSGTLPTNMYGSAPIPFLNIVPSSAGIEEAAAAQRATKQ